MGKDDYITLFEGMILSSFRSVHLQRLMDAIVIVVLEVLLDNATEMCFPEDDDPNGALSADAAIDSLPVSILPRVARSS
jgi:hypothetical protein